jgi:aspartate/methionine/tyrosine aminotransferase
MEEPLERFRFRARYNLGESGARVVTVGELLAGAGVAEADAARAFLDTPLRDSPNWGRPDLRDAIARMHPGATRDDVLVTTGTSEALLLLFRQLRPRRTALAVPAFQLLFEVPVALGSAIVPLPVRWRADGAPFVDQAEWLGILRRERPDCVVVNSPHNPSGLVFDASLVEAVLVEARSWGAAVIGDEHYRLLASEEAVLGDTVYRPGPGVFVTGSFIKCLGCPGLRIGWCVGDREVLARMQNEKNYVTHTVNPVAEWIAYEVLKSIPCPIIEEQRRLWMTNRRTLASWLGRTARYQGRAPEGGLVTCVAPRGAGSRRHLRDELRRLSEAGVFVLSLETMAAYEAATGADEADPAHPLQQGLGFRLGLGADAATFAAALDVMESVA